MLKSEEIQKKIVIFWPLFLVLLIYSGLMALVIFKAYNLTGQKIIYTLDDAYIHMSIAKNIVLHGVWGVNSSGFTPSSSSPLWVLMLAVTYFVFGVKELAPGLFSIIFSILSIIIVFYVLRSFKVKGWKCFVWLLSIVVVTPMTTLTSTGLEHT
ncbi:MAG: hypothetical protein JW867_09035, partial [Candidatus Omnitrophica bacterium]|nr:hypothetical protein [Candidatus Omnitrophota bacterium]